MRGSVGVGGYEFLVLLVVVGVALAGGVWPALLGVLVGAAAGADVFTTPYGSFDVALSLKNAPLLAFILAGVAVAILVDELARLVAEQTELRQVEQPASGESPRSRRPQSPPASCSPPRPRRSARCCR